MTNKIVLPDIDCYQVADEICDFLIGQLKGKRGFVVGLSGGVDSSLVAFLCKRAVDRWNLRQNYKDIIRVYGLHIPATPYSGNSHMRHQNEKDAYDLAKKLSIQYDSIGIDNNCKFYLEFAKNSFDYGNAISRERANVLWTVAARENMIVVGTGNADEDFGIGYYTLGGDGFVQCSPNGMLSKRLVRKLASWIGVFENIINKKSSADLELNQTDYGDLGYRYEFVELCRLGLFNLNVLSMESNALLIEQFLSDPLVVEEAKEISENKFGSIDKTIRAVEDVFKRHETALYKQSIVHPPIAQITLI